MIIMFRMKSSHGIPLCLDSNHHGKIWCCEISRNCPCPPYAHWRTTACYTYYMEVSENGAIPSHHPFDFLIFQQKPSSYWGTLIARNLHLILLSMIMIIIHYIHYYHYYNLSLVWLSSPTSLWYPYGNSILIPLNSYSYYRYYMGVSWNGITQVIIHFNGICLINHPAIADIPFMEAPV